MKDLSDKLVHIYNTNINNYVHKYFYKFGLTETFLFIILKHALDKLFNNNILLKVLLI